MFYREPIFTNKSPPHHWDKYHTKSLKSNKETEKLLKELEKCKNEKML